MSRTRRPSAKHLLINKANTTMLVTVAVGAFVAVFSLVGSKALLNQQSYQSRVIAKKTDAKEQLDKNVRAVEELLVTYEKFASSPVNVLGGDPSGAEELDGDNTKIILDALPSKYDFPALTTSLEKILIDRGLVIQGIEGLDDEIAQQEIESTATPESVEMPFTITAKGNYLTVQEAIDALHRSIRPFNIGILILEGSDGDLQLTVTGTTYYQPERGLTIEKKVVR